MPSAALSQEACNAKYSGALVRPRSVATVLLRIVMQTITIGVWIMKLSEQLQQDHDSGDFGKALEGYAERALKLEQLLKEAAELFRFYEDSHRKRGDEHLEKAERNAEIAKRIEAALDV